MLQDVRADHEVQHPVGDGQVAPVTDDRLLRIAGEQVELLAAVVDDVAAGAGCLQRIGEVPRTPADIQDARVRQILMARDLVHRVGSQIAVERLRLLLLGAEEPEIGQGATQSPWQLRRGDLRHRGLRRRRPDLAGPFPQQQGPDSKHEAFQEGVRG